MKIRETSDYVCNKLISKLLITDNSIILEPSCGEGKILEYLYKNYSFKGLDITGIELNKERLIKAKGSELIDFSNKYEFIQKDFLEYTTDKVFHYIVAAPPFKGNIDLEHIIKMESLLKFKGMLASLISPYFITNNEPHQVKFREWLQTKQYSLDILPDNTFIEKDKTVPTAIITIYKK